MILISHRGNLVGPSTEENHPDTIYNAIEQGFHVEIDLWSYKGSLHLGHDKPKYKVPIELIEIYIDKLWCHCKDIDSFMFLLNQYAGKINCFFHTDESYVLTSQGYIWVHTKATFLGGICVMPEERQDTANILSLAAGICSDFIQEYK